MFIVYTHQAPLTNTIAMAIVLTLFSFYSIIKNPLNILWLAIATYPLWFLEFEPIDHQHLITLAAGIVLLATATIIPAWKVLGLFLLTLVLASPTVATSMLLLNIT